MSDAPTNGKPRRRYQTSRANAARLRILGDWRGASHDPNLQGFETTIASVVGRLLKKSGVEDRLSHEEMGTRWESIVGPFLAQQSRPIAIRKGYVQIAVMQATVRYDLQRRWTQTVLEKLQAIYGPDKIRGVRFVVG
jgi:hypothetical protein